jgi:hypothetical protein
MRTMSTSRRSRYLPAIAAALTTLGPVLTSAPAAAQESDQPTRTLAEEGFAGIYMRDIIQGEKQACVVSWVLPGPFAATGQVRRGDTLLSVNGDDAMTREKWNALIEAAAPGDVMTVTIRRGNGDIDAAIPDPGDATGEVVELEVSLGSRDEWEGTIARPNPDRVLPDPEASELEMLLLRHADDHAIREGVDELLDYFRETQENTLGYHALNRVVAGFFRPLSVDAVARTITDEAAAVPSDPMTGALRMIAHNLDLDANALPDAVEPITAETPADIAHAMQRAIADARAAGCRDIFDDRLAGQAMGLVSQMAASVYLTPETAHEHIEVMRRSVDVDFDAVLAQAAALARPIAAGDLSSATPIANAADLLQGAATGDVLHIAVDPEGFIIVGGAGPNTYDMDRILAVYDPGGNDEYRYASPTPGKCTLVIDERGDDRHTSTTNFAGPASAVVGAAVIDDRAGNDHYEGRRLSCGAGLLGVGILLDRGGHDVYKGTDWSQGVGFYGAGLIIDLGGSDEYLGEMRAQGVGGPKALGAIVDANGADLYRANGPHGSVYGTPAVYVGLSQGFGYGVRLYSAGGVGLIADLAGHDRYEAGEFSQGGGYYWGIGILHDRNGNDLYYGNRYGQGFGCHQSLGILTDDAGDDTYWTMTAANQGGSWDIGVGLLVDRAGNDAYRADGLSQGSASQQAIGILLDIGGQDRYSGAGRTQGLGGGNRYHYQTSGCFSFNALVDCGPERDYYSAGRTNDSTTATGVYNEDRPEDSSIYGLFIDGVTWGPQPPTPGS